MAILIPAPAFWVPPRAFQAAGPFSSCVAWLRLGWNRRFISVTPITPGRLFSSDSRLAGAITNTAFSKVVTEPVTSMWRAASLLAQGLLARLELLLIRSGFPRPHCFP